MINFGVPGFIKAEEDSNELVVILHGYSHRPGNLRHVQARVTELRPRADLYIPMMPTGLISVENPVSIVSSLISDMDRLDREKGPAGYERITLIGHSLGALLVRKMYLVARGENADAQFERQLAGSEPRDWASRVDRIVLLAGMNRGWSISHHLTFLRVIAWSIGIRLGGIYAFVRRRTPLIFTIRRGAPFITQLRVQWLSMLRRARDDNREVATTIQLLGSIDDMVSPDDNIDLATGGQFIYLDVPATGHENVIDMDETLAGSERSSIFARAMNDEPRSLKRESLQPGDLLFMPDDRVKNVIFVIHGIRDEGFWTHKVARKVMTIWKAMATVDEPTSASVTSSYGYYPMLPFLIPGQRLEKVRWLMDQYTEAMSRYPAADFHYGPPIQ